jgi:hypothetical protein
MIWAFEILLYSAALVLALAAGSDWRSEIASVACLLVPLLTWYWVRSGRASTGRLRGNGSILAPLLIALLLDTTWQLGLLIKPAPLDEALRPSPAEAYLRDQPGLFRAYGVGGTLSPAVAAQNDLDLLEGAAPFLPAYLARLINRAAGCTQTSYSVVLPVCMSGAAAPQAYLDAVPDARLLGLLNVRYLIAEFELNAPGLELLKEWEGLRLYENREALPRAFVVGRAEVLADQEQVWNRLPEVDPGRIALVAEPLPGALDVDRAPQGAQVLERTSSTLHLRVDLEQAGMLVVSQTWAPGWRATDNGRSLPLYRTDYALQGAYLEAGAHEIKLVYRPPSWRWGLALTLSGLALCALSVALPRSWAGRTSPRNQ